MVTNEIFIADAPAKFPARFLTERGVQTLSGRSTTWQATTVQRMKARWSDQTVEAIHSQEFLIRHSLCEWLRLPWAKQSQTRDC